MFLLPMVFLVPLAFVLVATSAKMMWDDKPSAKWYFAGGLALAGFAVFLAYTISQIEIRNEIESYYRMKEN